MSWIVSNIQFNSADESLVIAGRYGERVEITLDGSVRGKVFWSKTKPVSGLWEESLKFFDRLIQDFKDVEVEGGVLPRAWIYYENAKVYLSGAFAEVEVGKARFRIQKNVIYLTPDEGENWIYEVLGFSLLAEFISRYYSKVLKFNLRVKFKKVGDLVKVGGIEFGTDRCRCLTKKKLIGLAKSVDLQDLLDWLVETVKTKEPDDIGFKSGEIVLFYGNLMVYFSNNFKFLGFEYKCGCLKMKLKVFDRTDTFEFEAKKINFYLNANVIRIFSSAQGYYKALVNFAQRNEYLKALGF